MIRDIVEKNVATQTLEDLDNLIDWLNAEEFYARFTQEENFYIQTVINEHCEHIKNPCYEV